MRKYDELVEALKVWNQAVLKYDEDSVTTIGRFIRGFAAYLGIAAENVDKAFYWYPPPGERAERGTRTLILGSRYPTKREGYAFTAGILINGSPTHAHEIPLEFYRASADAPSYTLRAFEKDFEFSESGDDAWNPVYEFIVDRIKTNFLGSIAATKKTEGGSVN